MKPPNRTRPPYIYIEYNPAPIADAGETNIPPIRTGYYIVNG